MNNPRIRNVVKAPGNASGNFNSPIYPGIKELNKEVTEVKDIARFGRLRVIAGSLIANEERKILPESQNQRQFLIFRCVTGQIAFNVDQGLTPDTSLIVLPATGYIIFDTFVPQNEIYVKEASNSVSQFVITYAQLEQ